MPEVLLNLDDWDSINNSIDVMTHAELSALLLGVLRRKQELGPYPGRDGEEWRRNMGDGTRLVLRMEERPGYQEVDNFVREGNRVLQEYNESRMAASLDEANEEGRIPVGNGIPLEEPRMAQDPLREWNEWMASQMKR
jgi:hypothetical protein